MLESMASAQHAGCAVAFRFGVINPQQPPAARRAPTVGSFTSVFSGSRISHHPTRPLPLPRPPRTHTHTITTFPHTPLQNGYAIAADVPGTQSVQSPMAATIRVPPAASTAMSGPTAEARPAWVAYDRKVLRFYGYFKETVTESSQENFRVRRCVIYYYLEDGSIHVEEPKQANSGIPQGVFLKRHRIPKSDGSYVGLSDLVVGQVAKFYGRSFCILSCDPFTRSFLTEQGIEVAPDQDLSKEGEPIEEYRAAHMKKGTGGPPKPRHDSLTRFIEANLGRASNSLNDDKLAQFVENDGKVLRFFCVWDDRDSYAGDRLKYILHYFLADDTVEILEKHGANTGRTPFPVFLKRDKLPLGQAPASTLGSTGPPVGSVRAEHLRVGSTLSVFGRNFFIYACDEFTRNYYMETMGLDAAALAPPMVHRSLARARHGRADAAGVVVPDHLGVVHVVFPVVGERGRPEHETGGSRPFEPMNHKVERPALVAVVVRLGAVRQTAPQAPVHELSEEPRCPRQPVYLVADLVERPVVVQRLKRLGEEHGGGQKRTRRLS